MSDPRFPEIDGATPLTDAEREGLIPAYLALRGELNEAEQANILETEDETQDCGCRQVAVHRDAAATSRSAAKPPATNPHRRSPPCR